MDTNVTYNLYAHYATESQKIYGNIDHYVLNRIKACGSDGGKLTAKGIKNVQSLHNLVRTNAA